MADGQSAADAAMMAGPGAAAAAAIADAPAVGTDGAAAAAAPPPGIQLKANMGVSTNTKWTYKDDAGVDQGPYSTLQLNQWYLAGYMKSDRMVKKVKASIKFFEAGGGGEKEEEIALGDVPELVSAARPPTAQEQQEMLRAQLLAQQSMLYKQGLGAPTVTDVVNKIFELPEGCEGMLLGSVKNWNDSKGFGFIIPGATGEHIFVHREDIRNAPKNGSLVRGMNVLYNKVATPTGQDRATDVCMADGTDIEPGQGGGGRYGDEPGDHMNGIVPGSDAGPKLSGTVKNWNPERGWGFVNPDIPGNAVFMHRADIIGEPGVERPQLFTRQRISYNLGSGREGKPRATNIMNFDGSRVGEGEPLYRAPTTQGAHQMQAAAPYTIYMGNGAAQQIIPQAQGGINAPQQAAVGSPPAGMAPPPNVWQEYKDPSGKPYYYNAQTRQTTWDQPQAFGGAMQQQGPPPGAGHDTSQRYAPY